ncbi:PH domain-containing protein [Asticcacaulis sp. AC402]|uniref:PH domain-containing protein n=1 Tax=Asticcacaulis sp. AC402 TaxID=1282361 RepID=UPI0003C3C6A7|nr:PH domain-containing protein [Asticcacaulis sp. AC402]ESQ75478.1 membrane protein [Asticcacaulis sp. AC402]
MARYVDTALRPGEKILYDAKVHWAIFVTPFVRLIIFAAVLSVMWGVFNWKAGDIKLDLDSDPEFKGIVSGLFHFISNGLFFVILALVALGGFVNALIYYFNSDFVLTDRRVIAKFGLLSRTTSEQRLSKVESIHVYQSFLGRLLNYGNITVTGTGSSETKFGPMVDPVACKHALEEELDRNRNSRED